MYSFATPMNAPAATPALANSVSVALAQLIAQQAAAKSN